MVQRQQDEQMFKASIGTSPDGELLVIKIMLTLVVLCVTTYLMLEGK